MLQAFIRQFLFSREPEAAHKVGQQLIRWRYSALLSVFSRKIPYKPVSMFGLNFSNAVGLAAGWDKDGLCIDALFRIGFGFVEVGTVTPLPQAGNPHPRLFRIPEKQSLINRMGFNNAGVDALVHRLKQRTVPGILGVNIGKNKATPLERALDDYVSCLNAVYLYADYIVVNISSPNTPGLRELQSATYLQDLLSGIQQARTALEKKYQLVRPLLVKTTVDLPQSAYQSFVQALKEASVDGIIISNTTVDHSAIADSVYAKEVGGLSGAPLKERVTRMIADIKVYAQEDLPIVGVGGILSADDALAHREAGADLLQIYTGFVYRGPELLREILASL